MFSPVWGLHSISVRDIHRSVLLRADRWLYTYLLIRLSRHTGHTLVFRRSSNNPINLGQRDLYITRPYRSRVHDSGAVQRPQNMFI